MLGNTIKINEIFYSIQGEGIYAGIPMAFVRLQGCNFNPGCSYCDTSYAQGKEKKEEVEKLVDEVIQKVEEYVDTNGWVCVTGGEPLMQHKSLVPLLEALNISHCVEVETNGSISPYLLSEEVLADTFWSVDIKCPSSKVTSYYAHEWIKVCEHRDQIKFVVVDKEDLRFVSDYLYHNHIDAQVVVQPAVTPDMCLGDILWAKQVAEFCKEEGHRFSLQIHKILWKGKKGV